MGSGEFGVLTRFTPYLPYASVGVLAVQRRRIGSATSAYWQCNVGVLAVPVRTPFSFKAGILNKRAESR